MLVGPIVRFSSSRDHGIVSLFKKKKRGGNYGWNYDGYFKQIRT